MLKRTQRTFTLSDYTKVGVYYAIVISEHPYELYLFATLADFTTGDRNTSPFTIMFNGRTLYIIVGAVEPVNVTVDFWGY
jgi:hypothetical protein